MHSQLYICSSFNVKLSEFWWFSACPRIKLIDSQAEKAFTYWYGISEKKRGFKTCPNLERWKASVQNIFELYSSVLVDLQFTSDICQAVHCTGLAKGVSWAHRDEREFSNESPIWDDYVKVFLFARNNCREDKRDCTHGCRVTSSIIQARR